MSCPDPDSPAQPAIGPEASSALRHFAQAVEACDDGVWDWNLETGASNVNAQWFRLRGLEPLPSGVSSYALWQRTVHPDDLPVMLAALAPIRAGTASSFRCEYRIVQANGGERWIIDRGGVVERDDDGVPIRLAGLNSDITARKTLEKELLRKTRLLDVLNRVQETFIRNVSIRPSADRLLAGALEATESGFGFIAEVLHDEHGKAYLQTYAQTDLVCNDEMRAHYAQHAATGLQFRNHNTLFGYTLRTGRPLLTNSPSTHVESGGLPKGHPPLESYAGLPVYSGTRIVGMVALANRPGGYDPTVVARLEPLMATFAVMIESQAAQRERASALARTLETKARLRNIANGIPGAVIQWRTRGSNFGDISFMSDGIHALTGLLPAEVQATPRLLLRAIEPSARRAVLSALLDGTRRLAAWTADFRLNARRDDDGAWCRLAVQPRAVDGGSVEWTGVIIDISETKRLERQQCAAKEAADAGSRAKSAFLASMSHEIRTPIHAILGYLELLQHSALEAPQQRQVGIVIDATRSLKDLLDDILDFSRIEAGKISMHPQAIDLHELLEQFVPVWSAAASRAALTLVLDNRLAPGVRYFVDPMRLQEILGNLVSNAIKFTERGGVTISAGPEADASTGLARLRFEVADTGIGIQPAAQQRIFSPFEQEDGETTRRFGGSGLGLAISRRLVELMGGELSLVSTPGRGTCMRVEIPALPAAPIRAETADAMPGELPPRGLRVLIAEDNAGNRELLQRQLQHFGAEVTAVAGGGDALAAIRGAAYDLVLTDCHMPDIDGASLARRIREYEKDGARSPVPIVAFTADALPETERLCLDAGMNGHVPKPISMAMIQATLNRWSRPAPQTEPAAVPGKSPGTRESSPAPADRPPDSPAQAGERPVIDEAVLRRVTGGIPWLRRKALSLFVKNLPPELQRLDAAVRDGNAAAIGEFCHSLTGAARTIGAMGLDAATSAMMAQLRTSADAPMLAALHLQITEHAQHAAALAERLTHEES